MNESFEMAILRDQVRMIKGMFFENSAVITIGPKLTVQSTFLEQYTYRLLHQKRDNPKSWPFYDHFWPFFCQLH